MHPEDKSWHFASRKRGKKQKLPRNPKRRERCRLTLEKKEKTSERRRKDRMASSSYLTRRINFSVALAGRSPRKSRPTSCVPIVSGERKESRKKKRGKKEKKEKKKEKKEEKKREEDTQKDACDEKPCSRRIVSSSDRRAKASRRRSRKRTFVGQDVDRGHGGSLLPCNAQRHAPSDRPQKTAK